MQPIPRRWRAGLFMLLACSTFAAAPETWPAPDLATAWADDDDDDGGDDDDRGDDGDDDDDDDGGTGAAGGGDDTSAGGGGPSGGGSAPSGGASGPAGGSSGPTGGGGGSGGDGAPWRGNTTGPGLGALIDRLLDAFRPLAPWAEGGERRDAELVVAPFDPATLPALLALGYVPIERSLNRNLGIDAVRLRVPPGVDPEAARTVVAEIAPTSIVDVNHLYRAEAAPEALRAAIASVRWPRSAAAASACPSAPPLGLIDTRINTRHAALSGQDLVMAGIGSRETKPSDAGHGTAIAALLAGRADGRSPGLLPDVRLVAVDPFARADGTGDVTDAFQLVAALDRLLAAEVAVVNLSLAGPANRLLEAAVRAADRQRVVLVAAVGNGGPAAAPAYPAAYSEVIAVTAVDDRGQPYRRAQRGAHVDLAAPGVNLPLAASIRGVRPRSGTSIATPFVAAAAWHLKAANPRLDSVGVRRSLAATARDLGAPGRDEVFGAGLLQAPAACGQRAGAAGE